MSEEKERQVKLIQKQLGHSRPSLCPKCNAEVKHELVIIHWDDGTRESYLQCDECQLIHPLYT